jgi:hypothetical protein
MTRSKGRVGPIETERTHPHIVELNIPPGGFGKRLDVMAGWHRERGLEVHEGKGYYAEPNWYARRCFAKAAEAKAFQSVFGGELRLP